MTLVLAYEQKGPDLRIGPQRFTHYRRGRD